MENREMNISIADFKIDTEGSWYRDKLLNQTLNQLSEYGEFIQCTYENHIVLRSPKGEAVFDQDGNLCELYDFQSQSMENIANQPQSKELEFEMLLMFSKINR